MVGDRSLGEWFLLWLLCIPVGLAIGICCAAAWDALT